MRPTCEQVMACDAFINEVDLFIENFKSFKCRMLNIVADGYATYNRVGSMIRKIQKVEDKIWDKLKKGNLSKSKLKDYRKRIAELNGMENTYWKRHDMLLELRRDWNSILKTTCTTMRHLLPKKISFTDDFNVKKSKIEKLANEIVLRMEEIELVVGVMNLVMDEEQKEVDIRLGKIGNLAGTARGKQQIVVEETP